MKKVFLLAAMIFAASMVKAQNYAPVKNMLALNQFAKAKEDFDKSITNQKYAAKPEAWMQKTCIYAGLAMNDQNKGTPAGSQLTTEADGAFTKYKEMDPEMELMKDPIYQNGPINLYSSYYTTGYTDYSAKKWEDAYQKLKKAVDYSDLLIDRKLLTVTLDTNVLILAGVTAENSQHKADAAKFYGKLADAKIKGDGFESIYRFLVSYSFETKNMADFEKYKKIGKELYPESTYFDFDKVDFAVGLADGFNNKLKAVEEVLATDPNNYKANEVMGEIIYDTLNPRNDEAVLPANFEELETKMINAFTKASAAQPNTENPYLYLGDHYINSAIRVNDARSAFVKEMQSRTKPGTKPSAEDVKKRDELDAKYAATFLKAQEPYEKAAAILAAKKELDARDKQQYKKAASYLSDIASFKKGKAKGNAAEVAKYTEEAKKWNDIYDSIK